MDHGSILVVGEPSELIKNHIGHNIIEIAEPSDEIRACLKDRLMQFEDLGHRIIVHVGQGDNIFYEISRLCKKEGCIMRMATLEDVFLKLTGRDLRE